MQNHADENPYAGMTLPDALRHLAKRFLRKQACIDLVNTAADELDGFYANMDVGPALSGMSDSKLNTALSALAAKGDRPPEDRVIQSGNPDTLGTFGTLQERIDRTAHHG